MGVEPVTYAHFDDPPEAMVRAVDQGLEVHNYEVAPISEVRPLGSFASSSTGQLIGGAVGRTWGACCELLQLWVAPEHRLRGIASELLQQFEQRATSRGCSVFYLTTLSYQSPDFYRKHGYVSIAEIRGYPNRIAKYLMYKDSNSSVDAS